jgi:hypothetical protein
VTVYSARVRRIGGRSLTIANDGLSGAVYLIVVLIGAGRKFFCLYFIGWVNGMTSKNVNITEAELSRARDYIDSQFSAHSWWPTEQPGEARREFDLMKGSAAGLNVWCERWMDAGQCKKLEKALRA